PAESSAELEELRSEVNRAKSRLDDQDDSLDLNSLWLRLEDIRASLGQRLDSMAGRTAAALETFAQVERLNSEDVVTVRRILQHIAAQLERFPQLSLNLKLQLDSALEQAEQLLEKLRGEFEATRNIADQLVSANILDELLGGGPAGPGPVAA